MLSLGLMKYLLQITSQSILTSEGRTSFWGISYDGWFTGLTPILIFILGYIINKMIENHKEKRRLVELEEYFKRCIELLEKPLNKQKKEFIKLSHSLKHEKQQHIYLGSVTNFHVERIKEISSKDLYTIFIRNKKGNIFEKTDLYEKLLASIDTIHIVKNSFKDDYLLLKESHYKYQQKYNKNLEMTDKLFYKMFSESKKPSLKEDLFLSKIEEIRLGWSSSKKEGYHYTDMYVAKQMYLEPIKDLCKESMRDPRSAEILEYIMLSIYAYNNVEEIKKVYRRHFLIQARELQTCWFDINNVLSKFHN